MSKVAYVFLLASLSSHLSAQDWPRFRGPNGSGIATSSHLPEALDREKNLSWKLAVPPCLSPPVGWGDIISLTALENKSLLPSAYNRDTGREIWTQKLTRKRES